MTHASRAPAASELPEPPIDGRRRRGQDSRERIVQAMLDLVEGGALAPAAEAVAARANVGLRTVFRHFKDMDSLYREMSEVISGEMHRSIVDRPFQAPTWRGRLSEIIRRRAAVYEKIFPFRRAADVHRHDSSVLQADHAAFVAEARDILRRELPPQIGGDAVRFEALDLLLSYDSWTRLRRDQHLSHDRAVEVLELTLSGLVDR
ncbi:MAG TPA: TetR/AcrR family transcriptional regulator [Caulobacteraceae bacterium]|nr:TetR/AcrR family transcriptional regulator [Caulobacteraceae bacterium]